MTVQLEVNVYAFTSIPFNIFFCRVVGSCWSIKQRQASSITSLRECTSYREYSSNFFVSPKKKKKKEKKKNVNSWILRKNKFLPVQSITFEQRRKVEGGSVANQFVQKV